MVKLISVLEMSRNWVLSSCFPSSCNIRISVFVTAAVFCTVGDVGTVCDDWYWSASPFELFGTA